ncbi:DUF892 family protein [Natronolimnobius baerhuensis]|uniref:Uncharacterized protein n=1 Tax=Natronolimnobius baerhuensis TaxID=253108 RepID=A0A202E651_9EURY|nr:DUF892 family protein [Natronolimnobius baerhuensis]OVE83400.1 hypothetical protein B2G88_13150 [Natronolimnobius baerhuensis]
MTTRDPPPHDALEGELARLYGLEQGIDTALETISNDVAIDTLDTIRELECREQLQYAIDQRRAQTDDRSARLEEAFDALNTSPETRPVPELDGLVGDKEKFNNVVLNDEVRPLYYVETMLKLEALECTRYERAISLARSLEDDAGDTIAEAVAPNYEAACDVQAELEALADGEAVDRLLAASQIDDADRASLDPYQ